MSDNEIRVTGGAAYAFRVGDYVLTGDDAEYDRIDGGVIIALLGNDDNMRALVCSNYFADAMLELGFDWHSIGEENPSKWFYCRDLMPDEDEDDE